MLRSRTFRYIFDMCGRHMSKYVDDFVVRGGGELFYCGDIDPRGRGRQCDGHGWVDTVTHGLSLPGGRNGSAAT
jgi:hypothetical protein